MFELGGATYLRWNENAYRYTPDGYGPACPLPLAQVTALTNPITQSILKAGYSPLLHPRISGSSSR